MQNAFSQLTTLLLVLMLGATTVLTTGCVNEGCTNPFSTNFDPEADEDDGSCELWIENFLGSYNINESCQSGNFTYDMVFTTSASGDDKMIINNFGGYGVNATATLTDENAFTVPNQTVNSIVGALTFSGSGSIAGSTLTFNYTVSQGSDTDNCTGSGTRQ